MMSPLSSSLFLQNASQRGLFLTVPAHIEGKVDVTPRTRPAKTEDANPLWSSAALAAVTSGRTTQRFSVSGVANTAKRIQEGYAIVSDSAKEIGAAWRKGATAVITKPSLAQHIGRKPALFVSDLDQALYDIAMGARERSIAERVMITGIADCRALQSLLQPHIAQGWHAGHCASTLTALHTNLANLPETAPSGLFAAPMNTADTIEEASTTLRPHILAMTPLQGLPLNGPARWQLEKMLDSLSGAFAGMDSSGIVILPRDTAYYAHLYAAARTQGVQQIFSYGVHEHAEMHLMDVTQNRKNGVIATLRVFGSQVQIPLPLPVKWRSNNPVQQAKLHMAALLVGAALGEDMKVLAEKLTK